ncbi:MAG TPA: glutamate-5-semialdehyde dehydrogenase [Lachnospiraceae bacterium]|nr:glutamate-5-semialdehyde dehydrogenase [Lachnospiraceae bacterium]
MRSIEELAKAAKRSSEVLRSVGTDQKNQALAAIASQLKEEEEDILKANSEDCEKAQKEGMRPILLDRLKLTPKRIDEMIEGVDRLIELDDPIGEVLEGSTRPNGLEIRKIRVPLGVVGMIFEARPNVAVDAACLCLKASDACLLRGGKEAILSTTALTECMRRALVKSGLPEDTICLTQDTSHESADQMMQAKGLIDVLIPRGSARLIQTVVENSKVPFIETGVGNCHIYVDEWADLDKAIAITVNAKTSRPSVCNAAESLVVHSRVAGEFLPRLVKAMPQVTLYGDGRAKALVPTMETASEEDFGREYLDLKMSVRIVDTLQHAIDHIAKYSTGHSETIVTENLKNARIFTSQVDSAAVYVNASTRFTDGGQFGEGAEIGISTQKLHARGPMGIKALTTTKFVVWGDGQIRL